MQITSISQVLNLLRSTSSNKPIASDSAADILASFQFQPVFISMSMKPNNIIALLVAAILLAIGIALAVINNHAASEEPKPASEEITFANPVLNSIEKGASYFS